MDGLGHLLLPSSEENEFQKDDVSPMSVQSHKPTISHDTWIHCIINSEEIAPRQDSARVVKWSAKNTHSIGVIQIFSRTTYAEHSEKIWRWKEDKMAMVDVT